MLFFIMEDLEYESLLMERVIVYFVVGVFVGVMEYCVMYFVDCVKVRLVYFFFLKNDDDLLWIYLLL